MHLECNISALRRKEESTRKIDECLRKNKILNHLPFDNMNICLKEQVSRKMKLVIIYSSPYQW